MSDEGIDYVLKAVSMVAEHGWKLLPQVCFVLRPIHCYLSIAHLKNIFRASIGFSSMICLLIIYLKLSVLSLELFYHKMNNKIYICLSILDSNTHNS